MRFLCSDPANARKHDERNLEAIKGSLARFGQQKPIVIDSAGVVVAGNGTLEAARLLGWETIEAVETALHGPEAMAYAIADNRTAELAEWNDEALHAQLLSLGEFDQDLAAATGFNATDLSELLSDGSADDGDEYTRKIESPVYEPDGDCPSAEKLYDTSKHAALGKAIEQAEGVPDDVKLFLLHAAARHIVFDYQQIANFYAHASKEVQELMEQSALVIVDFDRAIEDGYVKLSNELSELFKGENA